MRHFIHNNRWKLLISVVLMVLPFLWYPLGNVDIGGDGGRWWYIYPRWSLEHLSLFYPLHFGIGTVEAKFYLLPFIGVLWLGQQLGATPWFLVSFHAAVQLAGGFLGMALLVEKIITIAFESPKHTKRARVASLAAGLVYAFTPAIINIYLKAQPSHDQVFLNPWMLYLMLSYIETRNITFGAAAIVLSILFAHTFSYAAAPGIFAFYPLSLVFLFLLLRMRRISVPWLSLTFIVLGMILSHAFHVYPEIADLFTAGSNTHNRVFSEDHTQLRNHFRGVLPFPKVSVSVLAASPFYAIHWAYVFIPLVIVAGFIRNRRNRALPLAGMFFCITFFFVTAKVSPWGIALYERLLMLPGFGMFRNFFERWAFSYAFFVSLLFGMSAFQLFSTLKNTARIVVMGSLVLLPVLVSLDYIRGDHMRVAPPDSNAVSSTLTLDEQFESALDAIREDPIDGKYMLFPFTDCCYQVVRGDAGGAFVGRSGIGQLTGKKDFAGYADAAPFSDRLWDYAERGEYENFMHALGLMNVRYIFHNASPHVFDDAFVGYPYAYTRERFPDSQDGYTSFIATITDELVGSFGSYHIYRVADTWYLPHIYTPTHARLYTRDDTLQGHFDFANNFLPRAGDDPVEEGPRMVYVDEDVCTDGELQHLCIHEDLDPPMISFAKITPTKYEVVVREAHSPFVLVLSEAFHHSWRVFRQPRDTVEASSVIASYNDTAISQHTRQYSLEDKVLSDTDEAVGSSTHFLANGYANGWILDPQDESQETVFHIVLTGQDRFYWGSIVSLVTLVVLGVLFVLVRTRRL